MVMDSWVAVAFYLRTHDARRKGNKIKFGSQWKRDHAENIESNLLVEKRN